MSRGPGTKSIHGDENAKAGSVVTPIYQTSTFAATRTEDLLALQGSDSTVFYTRYGNPSLAAAEKKIALLEGAERALVSGSGMAAVSETVLSLVGTGGRIVSVRDIYGGTHALFSTVCARMGIRVDYVPTTSPEALAEALRTPADLVYLESPTNPTFRLVDIRESARIAKERGVLTVIDSTFASPINSRPIELGVDVVLHSATKYLGGHSDISAGAVAGSNAVMEKIIKTHRLLGAVLDPHAAFLLERGIKTLPVRMRQHNETGMAIAEYLAGHPKVARVHYPGHPSHPQHSLAKRQMSGFGGVLAIDLKSDEKGAARFADSLQLVRNAPSLGSVESLVSIPVLTSHRAVPPAEYPSMGITSGTVRLSLGLEDVDDLIADLDAALKAV
ncbi:MAG TPA: PLP-dependent aspartate aminotransferase family protein [Candidatus Thermoplasmatota archaeon]|nr:PLP-dependent aspartate aminotransferase family protein [Candidatus Thermoplasmatota archaeon]